MKGFVLAWDDAEGVGAVIADDGTPHPFDRDDVLEGDVPRAGARARFELDGVRAVAVRLDVAPTVVQPVHAGVVVRDIRLSWGRVFWITFQFAVAAAVIAVSAQILVYTIGRLIG
jgi:hypothetical protein